MNTVIIEPNGAVHDMRFSIEATIAAAGMTSSCIKCGNNLESISSFLRQAVKSSSFVMLIGAMEPDGCGRIAAANALSLPLTKNQRAESYIRERCAAKGEDPARYLKCAMLPKGAAILPGDSIIPACFCAVGDNVLVLMDSNEDEALLERLGALLLSLGEISYVVPARAAATVAELPFDNDDMTETEPVEEENEPAAERSERDSLPKILIACIIAAVLLTVTAVGIFLGGNSDRQQTEPADKIVYKPDESSEPEEEEELWEELVVIEDDEEENEKNEESERADNNSAEDRKTEIEAQPTAPAAESSAPASSESESSSPASSAPDNQPVVIWQAESSSEAAAPAESQAEAEPEPVIEQQTEPEAEPVVIEQQPESEPVTVVIEQQPESEPEPETEYDDTDIERYDEDELPSAKRSVFDDKLSYTTGGTVKKMNAYDLVCCILQNETRGNLAPEALKAHAVATYSMIKYNNKHGTAPSVALNGSISQAVKDAVSEVLGVGVYYNGQFANTVYHSTSGGRTTSSKDVWGGALPYLVSVSSSYDKQSPSYKTSYRISSDKFARKVDSVYGIELDGDPEDWIEAEHDADGGYVGTVILGGESRAQGGSYGSGKKITGRSIREQLLGFAIRSHCFDVEYDDDEDEFVFTVYGYGHGVGMSQYGAHFMALDGYNFVEILHHYYSDTEIY